jgi:plastocyanin
MRTFTLILALCSLALVGVGCGDDDESSDSGSSGDTSADKQSGGYGSGGGDDNGGAGGGGGGKAQTLKLAADPGGALKFDKSSLTAEAGKVTIVMDNPSSLPHAVELEGNGVEEEGDTVEKGGVSKVTADVKAGEYEYYCPVGGHEAAGMKGTLTVQ